jgi:predicted membrane-bound spermidine synthase
VALALASVASAVFQLWMIKLAEFVLGPFNETFSLVLATVLIGLALGSFLAGRFHWAFHHAVLLALAGTVAVLVLFAPLAMLYAALQQEAARFYGLHVALKLGFVFVMMIVPATGFGATVPAMLHRHQHVARESGQLLCWSSLANALGFLLMAFVLHRLLDYGAMLIVVALLAAGAILVERGRRTAAARWALLLVGLALPALGLAWNEGLLYVGHTEFRSTKSLRQARSFSVDEQFKGAQDVFAITRKEGDAYFFINGYISIPMESPHEKYVGALSAMLAPRRDRALVLGVGSGASAGTVGLLFERTDAVEINRVVLDNLWRMAEYSFDIEKLPGVRIVHDDGIHYMKTSPERYSLILNTVTTPLYFSSSKLYTVDFLRHVTERLTADGVYTTWIDGRIGDAGLDIVLESLSGSFRHVWMMYLKTGYFLLGCSNAPLEFRQLAGVAGHGPLQDFFTREYAFPLRLLPYSLVDTEALELRAPGRIPANTLDFPALEFSMARGGGGGFGAMGRNIERRFDPAALARGLGPSMTWDAGAAALHACLRLEEDSPLRKLFVERLLTSPEDRLAFDTAALTLARELGAANAYYEIARVLQRMQRHAAAAEALGAALALDPTLDNANYHRAEALYELGRHEEALEHLLAEWRMDRDADVPLRMAMSLDRRRRFDEALAWLDAAQLLGPASDLKRVAFWRGVAYEGLGRRLEAENQYVEALRADKKYDEARRALQGLAP